MDKFFTQKYCDRCGGNLSGGRILSMFNQDILCMECKDKETKHPDYKKAADADHEQIKQGNYNFKGMGYPNTHVTDKIIEQILVIRGEGKYNMFDTLAIQREAYEKGFHELVIFIQEHRKEYAEFMLSGKR